MAKEFKSVIDLLTYFSTQKVCINHLEKLRWDGNPISPFDKDSVVYKCKNNRYRCKNTGKYFNVLTGTMFENTKIPLQKWMLATWLITSHKKGISSVQLHKDLGITQKSAWLMLHKIRNSFHESEVELSGTVEADETFVGGKNKYRHKNKKFKGCQGRSCVDKAPVLGLMQRGRRIPYYRPHKVIKGRYVKEIVVTKPAKVVGRVMKFTNKEDIHPIMWDVLKCGTKLITDEWKGYNDLQELCSRQNVTHSKGIYVDFEDPEIHTNTIEGSWAGLKRSIYGIYHKTSRKHLQKYVDEYAFRYNTIFSTESERFHLSLMLSDKRLTYKTLING